MSYMIGVDVGGTFTDFSVFNLETGELINYKDSSTPDDPSRAIMNGVQQILRQESAEPEEVSYLAHGTTVGTNALIEKKGAKLGLITTEGFKDTVRFCKTDVTKEEEVEALVSYTVETFGSVDIYVNCAATWNYAKIYDLPKEDLQKVFSVNVFGAFYGVKYVSRVMKDAGNGGKIVLISSNCPVMPYPVFGGYPHYASSKAAIMGLTVETAKELKRYGIMVNSIAPGGMVTPGSAGNLASESLTDEQQDEFYDELMVWQTDGQMEVDQIGIMAYTMCTPAADGITGEVIMVDGGATHNIVKFQPQIDAYPPEED